MRSSLFLCLALLSASVAQAGHALVANEGRTVYWFDNAGKVTASVELTAMPHDMHVLDNGNLLTHQGTEIVEIDKQTQKPVWSFDTKQLATEDRVELHSVVPLGKDRLLVALSGEGKLFEIDRDGDVQRTITLKRDNPHPHRDTRLVRPVVNGDKLTYLVAQEGDGYVREYDRQGHIVWEYDVPMFGKEAKGGHGPKAFGDAVFSALRLPNGNTLIGTGNGHSILEVTPEKEIVWKVDQNDLKGVTLAWVTTLQVLDNGNIVLGNCHAGPGQPQIVEIDRDKNVVWSLTDSEHLGNNVSNSVVLAD
ncbi:esterase-like activity of phytase family protein [Roseiconus nitratireducens]|uniref:Esterase-like activity of phytase family protein n=1 Tax=Roseiconus nitratireducens TaxID=2605748 RepID=A0A5M6DCV8_9BACT|nr:PQQ-binding-like beta-propeller repeat protein [Roseiconus nitratireducens]KAA5545233.1 esterase-like activity of phytase family protein [Roseiconus nitratireducens]